MMQTDGEWFDSDRLAIGDKEEFLERVAKALQNEARPTDAQIMQARVDAKRDMLSKVKRRV